MKNFLSRGLMALTLGTTLAALSTSCTKDLDQNPKYELTPDRQYVDLAGYRQVMGKLYAGFALSGQADAGSSDISNIDGGTGNYLRQYWSAQELSTDEAVVAWNDPGIQDWHNMNWDANNVLINGLYNRIYYEIAICNDFLRESTDDKLTARHITGDDAAQVRRYRYDARFLRAVAYYNVVDLFGNGPFATETTIPVIGQSIPPYYTRLQLYGFVESELLACATSLPTVHTNEYGRVDQAAAWGYLARLYLNSVVFTGTTPTVGAPHTDGTAHWTDAATYAKKVLDAGYTLVTDASSGSSAYGRNFLADNNVTNATNEIIWPVLFDVTKTQSYGGTTFIINGSTSGVNTNWENLVGQTTGWGGLRGTSALVALFFKASGDTTKDTRGRFWLTPPRRPFQAKAMDTTKIRQHLNIGVNGLTDFTQGPGVLKFRNVNSAGTPQDNGQHFSGVDYPMLRASEMMLTYAEAVLRGGGDQGQALTYVQQVRNRAFNNNPTANSSIPTGPDLINFILDERGRELFWEGVRRTDLIRYRLFVEDTYLWPWKGGAINGKSVAPYRELYPLPSSDLTVNPNLKQNAGY